MPDMFLIFSRSVGAIAMLFLIARILGKKQISQLTFFEYIFGITLGELAGFLSTDIEANYLHGIVALGTWFSFAYLFEWFTMKSITLRRLLEGKGTVMIKDGKILERNLKKERFTGDELMESLRAKGVFNLSEVEFALLETSGELNVLVKKENQPLTPQSMGLKVDEQPEPEIVIEDGKIMEDGLAEIGFSKAWLKSQLDNEAIPVGNVFLGQLDATGKLYLDVFNDQMDQQELHQTINDAMKRRGMDDK